MHYRKHGLPIMGDYGSTGGLQDFGGYLAYKVSQVFERFIWIVGFVGRSRVMACLLGSGDVSALLHTRPIIGLQSAVIAQPLILLDYLPSRYPETSLRVTICLISRLPTHTWLCRWTSPK